MRCVAEKKRKEAKRTKREKIEFEDFGGGQCQFREKEGTRYGSRGWASRLSIGLIRYRLEKGRRT